MAENKDKIETPRLCKCEKPEEDHCYSACSECWKCKLCGGHGNCTKMLDFLKRLFEYG